MVHDAELEACTKVCELIRPRYEFNTKNSRRQTLYNIQREQIVSLVLKAGTAGRYTMPNERA